MTQHFYFSVCTWKNWKWLSKESLYAYIHNSTIYSNAKVETVQMPMDRWINKFGIYIVEYYLAVKRNEVINDECYNMDELQKHYAG